MAKSTAFSFGQRRTITVRVIRAIFHCTAKCVARCFLQVAQEVERFSTEIGNSFSRNRAAHILFVVARRRISWKAWSIAATGALTADDQRKGSNSWSKRKGFLYFKERCTWFFGSEDSLQGKACRFNGRVTPVKNPRFRSICKNKLVREYHSS